ncbi:MAG: NADH-quinone oxidoreductase subunit NuoF [Syntrophomonas sp.]|uniref:NADH-quinone oxidoreductase subunit NuoF n=1 Tax=Syntrophomonas sp. TaxID=2053627 RepID=UPI00260A885F|nr:NADH-quinone oxidoreductase subunit NuoF [Syntrophomonas sp.]MDD2509950.1 NADH-quinone oxidoreductase subunit NuoF [Syntrophomonas sp.]MDD3879615.1 NADH-quinone oxidoreductase subunit NuoF [Syntrophomonas sp.]MDD4626030.1 NADH-quinone oxidoreductase subunit NuoF [Syntrophomonas sp.]
MAEEMRIVLRNYGKIAPLKIDDYLTQGGYKSLEKARAMNTADLIAEVKKSNLRGRGGAGFNCGMKWSFAAGAQADQKYVICNADEGEPGTYKDRLIMENDPHTLIEGMAICAYAIGATQGYIYLRGEYPFLISTLNTAINQAREKGLVKNFDIEVRSGAGAYVCGEETALIESIEGKRGEPRFKPPYPPSEGLWSKPTIVNNVETFANIPVIIEKGADWYASIGNPAYPGTKVFTLTGDVNNRTFFEVPTSTTIREIVFQFGGGIPGGKKFKAVQIGGTSGAFIPEALLDTPVAFDSMSAIGATLGSGATFVIDESRDVVDVATRIAGFFEHESCGKCAPCREGTARTAELMEKINEGRGSNKDIALLEKLGNVMSYSCLCGLGQAAPAPVLTTIKHFKADYEAKFM